MTANILEWKATVIGLVLAAIIIAALFTRPSWGTAEIAQLVAAVGTALFGLMARLGSGETKEEPKA